MTANRVSLSLGDLEAIAGSDAARPGERGSITVRPGAKAFISDGRRVLLIKERRADGSTFWTLPGGGAEPGEPLRACLRRELAEELQCCSTVDSILTTCAYRHTSVPDTVTLYSVFAAELVTEPCANGDEGVVAYRWYDPSEPPLNLLRPFRQILLGLNEDDVRSQTNSSP